MDADAKNKLLTRLKRAEGQLSGVRRMVEQDAYCVDVLTQIAAVQGALTRVSQLLLGGHIEHCVAQSFATGDEEDRRKKVEELLDVFGRYGGLRGG